MNTNKTMLWIFAVMMTGFFCAVSAMADVVPPENAYNKLTAVELEPGNAPGLNGGVYALTNFETRYKEKLPVQLTGAMARVKRAKYQPSRQ
jgi:hypothetical protein